MRKTSIDEIPQLINILKGEMSFVGPRPVLPEEAKYIIDEHFWVKPGLTGPTQIHREKNLTLEEYNLLDREFVNSKHPIWRDLVIILKTFKVVFKGE